MTTDDTLRPDDKSSLSDTADLDDVRFVALCEAIIELCRGHRATTVRCALAAMLAETYAQIPLAERTAEAGYDLAIIRQYVRELPP